MKTKANEEHRKREREREREKETKKQERQQPSICHMFVARVAGGSSSRAPGGGRQKKIK